MELISMETIIESAFTYVGFGLKYGLLTGASIFLLVLTVSEALKYLKEVV